MQSLHTLAAVPVHFGCQLKCTCCVQAQAFNQEIQDLLMWLSDIDGQLASSKPVGGLPETAREQLNRFMVGAAFVVTSKCSSAQHYCSSFTCCFVCNGGQFLRQLCRSTLMLWDTCVEGSVDVISDCITQAVSCSIFMLKKVALVRIG